MQGFLQAYENATAEELHQLMTSDPLEYPGVDNSREFAEWLWDSGFAAVCTDSPGFEAMRKYSNTYQATLQKSSYLF